MSLPAILTASAVLENADAGLATLGFKHAFDEPPETIMQSLPCSVRFPEPGSILQASRLMGRYNIHNFKVEFHWPRGVSWKAVENILPVIDAVQTLYAANLSIGSTCDVCVFRDPAYEGPMLVRYSEGQPITLAVIFYFEAKEILDDIAVTLSPGVPAY